jgi:hypothetical protein
VLHNIATDIESRGSALLIVLDSREAEVGDLQEAVAVDEEVAGLQVAVQDIRRVDVLEPAKDLHRRR